MKSTIRLFKAVPIKSKKKKKDEELLKETLKRGVIVTPEVIYNYPDKEALLSLIESIGIKGEELNSSFHKSWEKIKNSSIEQLVLEQIIHYFTTYGFEGLGIYNEDSIYIPNEKLEVPDFKENLTFVVIKGYTKAEIKDKLMDLLNSGIALDENTIKDVLNVASFVELNGDDIEKVKNKEVKVALYEYLGLFPENPIEFLRYVIYRTINSTLLIKNEWLLEEIKQNASLGVVKLFQDYKRNVGLYKLAEIFYRFKPIFLAFKANEPLKSDINKIRKLAKMYHKPMPEDYLNTITSKIKNGEKILTSKLKEELGKVNTFRKIRLAYALKFRTGDVNSILYKIRNGKGYATSFSFDNKKVAEEILRVVIGEIVNDVAKNVKGKKVYIPKGINYSLPATEKQFTGDFPSGSFIDIPDDIVFGVHWKNIKGNRIDLDLSLISTGEKIGWDSSYRTNDRCILFSGDMTDAGKNGATELFYVRKQVVKPYIILLNYYNYSDIKVYSDIKIVPFKIIVARENVEDLTKNYMVNPNNIVALTSSEMTQKQKILGLVVPSENGNRFYFAETELGCSITSRGNEFVENARKYLVDFYENTIGLESILVNAGAEITKERTGADIDLSLESLEKDSIIKLLKEIK